MRAALRYRGVAMLEGRCGQCAHVAYWRAAELASRTPVTDCSACGASAVAWRWVAACPVCRALCPINPAELTTAPAAQLYCTQHGLQPVRAKAADSWRGIVIAILLAVLVRGFLIEAFKIPSSSMVPSLLIGDQIFVDKTAYGSRIPFTTRWLIKPHNMQRGDVAVFLYPVNPDIHFVKRVIGLPGDTIRVANQSLWINGELQPHTPATGDEPDAAQYEYFTEQLGDVTHRVRYARGRTHPEQTFTVPPEAFFVMGDNRDNSSDSRVWGIVPFAHLSGKAMFVWLPRRCESNPDGLADSVHCDGIRWDRLGQWVE